jgi:transposase
MQHLAIDLGSRESQVCIRNADGDIVSERKVHTAKLSDFLARQPLSRVILETSAEAFLIADAASEHGHEVRVVPATLVRTLGIGERRMKNDQRDARKLSEVSVRIDLPRRRICESGAREDSIRREFEPHGVVEISKIAEPMHDGSTRPFANVMCKSKG